MRSTGCALSVFAECPTQGSFVSRIAACIFGLLQLSSLLMFFKRITNNPIQLVANTITNTGGLILDGTAGTCLNCFHHAVNKIAVSFVTARSAITCAAVAYYLSCFTGIVVSSCHFVKPALEGVGP